ncbi:hypothetical protein SAMN04488009_0322 [Maribacter sedimenticola]|uniref:Uncharacterized protein n=1 Tax=Maribacter sedimenticola TaxID=228956 RepID=A0ABY1SCN5_9FLAO|nr:hypothetical protein SAMN04488009_0322 [Maribacter sedimenticola]
MLKNILILLVVFIFVGTTSYFIHFYTLVNEGSFKPLLEKAYLFHGFFSLGMLILFTILAQFKKFFDQLGFIYMGLLVFKIVIFTSLFYPQLLGDNLLPRFYRASLLIPVIVFLPLEVIFISKLMRSKKA